MAALLAVGAAGCSKSATETDATTAASASDPKDFNGTWAGPTPEFTVEDAIPLPAITRNVGWAPFSEGLPESRKAPSREEQLKRREAFLIYFRKIVASGGNVFAKNGIVRSARATPLPLTDAGGKALDAADKAAVSNRIPEGDENSLLNCYPQNYSGLGDPVTIVQAPKALVFYAGTRTRIVYLDGRSFDTAPVSDYGGYSIGHWEGDTLVIETKNFRGPVLGSAFGPQFPLSDDAVLTEYVTKIEDGKTLQIKSVFEDPVFFKEKMGKMEYLSWSPDLVPVNENCIEGLVGNLEYDRSKFKPQ